MGGALGTLLRAGGMVLLPPEAGAVPWVILIENVVGAFLLGWLTGWLLDRQPVRPWLEDFLVPGMLGSFTTFSALAVDAPGLGLVRDSGVGIGGAYLALSVTLGFMAAAAGLAFGGWKTGGGRP